MSQAASNLQIDSARLWDTIHETAKFGATKKGGIRRLTLGPEDKQVRDWFRTACEAAGLDVHVDALGSMFALRKGRDMSKAPVGLGSHLDTQPTGGKFDGVLGTLAALEVVRTLNDAGIETETPICIVNWTNEEGSRFAPATMASAAYAGDYTTECEPDQQRSSEPSCHEGILSSGSGFPALRVKPFSGATIPIVRVHGLDSFGAVALGLD